MITGVAAATGQEEVAGPLIAAKEMYDNFDHVYQEGDIVFDAIIFFLKSLWDTLTKDLYWKKEMTMVILCIRKDG